MNCKNTFTVITLFLFLLNISIAQQDGYFEKSIGANTEKGYYVNGEKDGTWVTELRDGSISKIESFKDGVKQGIFLEFDRKGHISKQSYYKEGVLHGWVMEYSSSNKLSLKVKYVQGEINGMRYTYYDNGTEQEESQYRDGKKNGYSKWFDDKHKLIAEYSDALAVSLIQTIALVVALIIWIFGFYAVAQLSPRSLEILRVGNIFILDVFAYYGANSAFREGFGYVIVAIEIFSGDCKETITGFGFA